MAQLLVRNLSDEVVHALRLRAAEHGRSVEEEHRELLRSSLLMGSRRKPDFKALLLGIPEGDDELFDRSSDFGRAVDL